MHDRSHLLTELRLPASEHIDRLSVEDQLAIMHEQDRAALDAVAKVRTELAAAVRLVTDRLACGGRLFYVGAGTSGRLGVLDASEIPPTFRADPSLVQGIIAGGEQAVFRAQEGAEDDPAAGARALDERNVGPLDVVMGIAAGGTTPFVHGALRRAIQLRAATLFLSCVQPVPDEPPVDIVLRTLTGPEVITGSTRLKAGTATKLVLNTLTTLAMVGLGKTYGNLMVDLKASNAKLVDRGVRLVMTVTAAPREEAQQLLSAAGNHVKLAIAMKLLGCDAGEATRALERAQGKLAGLAASTR
jgi:N-acetylmuramic acid 6-phosphate etherase